MVWFIFGVIFLMLAAGYGIWLVKRGGTWQWVISGALVLLGIWFIFIATFWSNGPGEAKIMVNTFDRTYSEEVIVGPGSGFKPAWIDFVEFDLSNQELVYAGKDKAPEYTGGTVNGQEITISVGGTNGGSTQGWMDATFIYNLDADSVLGIYKQYPYPDAQSRFTKAIINKQVLSSARQIPSNYTAVTFRGSERPDAEQALGDSLNARLGKQGIVFSVPTIQDVRYPKSVEKALKAVEVANQKQQEAEANLRATEVSSKAQVVEAEAEAKAAIARAAGEAEANRLLTASLTPEVLQSRLIEAYDEGTVFVVPNGSNPLVNIR